jgi:hypothetical protein
MVKLEYKGTLKKTIGVQKELYGVFEDRDPDDPQFFYELLILPHPDIEPFLGKKVEVIFEINEVALS